MLINQCSGNPDAKRLYDDLLSNYNKLVRPVVNVTDALTVKIKLKLSQLIDVNLKNQIMTTNLWVEQSWYDYKLQWDPKEYGGVEMLHVPSDHIWRPDIVLYNNADGNFEVTLATKATLNYTGRVEWKPPAIYKSSCEIDVEYFPFDEQTCVMKFGSWTYDGFQVDLRHIDEAKGSNVVKVGIDLSEFYTSVEWDILEVPAVRNEKFYTCCDEPYLDITFNITMRRKTLFYTVNLIIPCMGISFLTVLVFYLPSDSGEKVSLSISILLSLTVFFLLLAEIIPPTSLVVPLLGKFVLFTMILDTFRVFIHVLPRLLVMRRPHYQIDRRSLTGSSHKIMVQTCNGYAETSASELLDASQGEIFTRDDFGPQELEAMTLGSSCRIHGTPILPPLCGDVPPFPVLPSSPVCRKVHHWHHCPELHKAIDGVKYIADHTKKEEADTRVKEDWKYVAMVLDRLFLWIFTLAVLVGTAGIILQAPTLYDDRIPIDVRLSEIASTTAKPHVATSL
ncbi:acetylcholine receptor protein alpha 1, 2, 3, 4 invertebrate, putative [Pediculus humanus corporis]|uniref:Acetylcholine receptor protein alpha 1, 2, 3, 4 invertebrate, putative n=1 Tax=Pediculus humanus subsp. corporis TaxID=121224 RepID=E0VB20_PEDHC|nr:acetylcholine receptor protein alpha 1, 2, 3, 4 invertebrate, putative [Pediculus humanus corporis]EEB10576.1 acetylcholine receptor protein alpha 1, 2, 3, 4 invertebrate, putative [Pediculus humanus corporis]